jgi:anti-sigma-K factor RskA
MADESHVLDLLPAYALGSLEAEEAQQVEENLLSCWICRLESRQFQTIAMQLSLSIPPVASPPALKERLMQRIRDEQATRPTQAQNPVTVRPWLERLLPVWGLASLALILILGVLLFGLWRRINRLEIATAPGGMRALPLSATGEMPGATGFVLVGADGMNGAVVVDGLAPLDESQQYQVWLIRDEKGTSGAVFSTDEQNYGGTRIRAPGSLLEYQAIVITIEPAGGSPQPTGAAVLGGSLFNP